MAHDIYRAGHKHANSGIIEENIPIGNNPDLNKLEQRFIPDWVTTFFSKEIT
jgi:hypothetical protein